MILISNGCNACYHVLSLYLSQACNSGVRQRCQRSLRMEIVQETSVEKARPQSDLGQAALGMFACQLGEDTKYVAEDTQPALHVPMPVA